MGNKYVLVSRKSTTSFVLEKRARYFEKQRIAEEEKLCILCEIRLVACFLATQVVFFLLLFGCMLDTNHQRSVSEQSRTSFQEWKYVFFQNRKFQKTCVFHQRMEMLYTIGGGEGTGARHFPRCLFCKCRNFDDIWLHYKGCKGVPEEQRKGILEMYENMVSSAEKDWREFLERRFEPHHFRKRWENIVCPYCGNPCKNIYHSFSCFSTPVCRRDTNKKIAFWNGS